MAGSQDFSIVEGGDGDTTVVNVMGEIDMGRVRLSSAASCTRSGPVARA
jgi:hypothetical protein